jgi:AcrR family transcriptional regulator
MIDSALNHAAVAAEGPRRGRPRSAESERAILQAALDLLAEGQGPASISIAAIARRAGKDTIYRRWPSKDDLLVDALASQLADITVGPDAGLREAMVELLTDMIGRLQKQRDRRILQSMRGAGDDFPKLKERYYEQVIRRRQALVRRYAEVAEARGELKPGAAASGIVRMPFDHVIMAALDDRPIEGDPRQAAERLTDTLLSGIQA